MKRIDRIFAAVVPPLGLLIAIVGVGAVFATYITV